MLTFMLIACIILRQSAMLTSRILKMSEIFRFECDNVTKKFYLIFSFGNPIFFS